MSITEIAGAMGEWSVKLREDTPVSLLDDLGYFGHVAVMPGRVDPEDYGDNLLSAARYVGVTRSRSFGTGNKEIKGSGMAFWLGDEDEKGHTVESTPIAFSGSSFAAVINGLLPPTIHAGNIASVPGTHTNTYQFVSRRKALDYACSLFNAEYRVRGNGLLDAGLVSDLYVTQPKAAILRNRNGLEMDYRALPGIATLDSDVKDFTTRTILLSSDTNDNVTLAGSADIAPGLNPYVDLFGNPVKFTRVISETATDTTNAPARAQLQLNRFTAPRDAVSLSSEFFDIRGEIGCGDYVWVWDPDAKIEDQANPIEFYGETIYPVKQRVFQLTWPVGEQMGVYFRTNDGRWLDLSDYFVPEGGSTSVVVGGYDRSLTGVGAGSGDTIGKVVPPDATVPDVPTWVQPFVQGVYRSASGITKAQVQLVWVRPVNVDGSVISDGDHYEIRYRTAAGSAFPTTWSQASGTTWNTASGQPWSAPIAYVNGPWQTAIAPFDATSFLLSELTTNLPYEVQIRAVDKAQPTNYGAWSASATFQTIEDRTPPVTPAAAIVVGSTMSILVKHLLGAASGGTFNLDLDTDHLNVYGSYEPTFAASSTLKIGEMPANASMIKGGIPSVKTFQVETTDSLFIKVEAVDAAGNPSAISAPTAVVPGLIPSQYISDLTVDQLSGGTLRSNFILGADIGTAGPLAGMHMNSAGLQGYKPDGTVALNFATADGSMYVLGEFRTAPSGQRLVINQGGIVPDSIYVFPSASGDFGRIMARTAPSDGSAAILIDGGAAAGIARGRVGAYKTEAFISHVTNDVGGDTSAGFSRTAVVCNTNSVIMWTQDQILLQKYSGSSVLPNSTGAIRWATGTISDCLVMGGNAQDAGIKFDQGTTCATNAIGTLFGPMKATAFTVASSGDSKEDIAPVSKVFKSGLIAAHRGSGRSQSWKYKDEVEQLGKKAPIRFGPIAENMPPELVRSTPKADGSGMELSVDVNTQVGFLWGVIDEILDLIDARGK